MIDPELQRAAEQGDADAQYRLGKVYYFGDGVPWDYKEALKWYQKAADLGNADAQYQLGVMYYAGEGVLEDASEAVKEPLIKDPSMKISAHWIKKWERTEGQKGLRLQSGG